MTWDSVHVSLPPQLSAIRPARAIQERWESTGVRGRFDSTKTFCASQTGRTELTMIQNRELTLDDYLAMLHRRMWVILLPSLLAPLVGFAVSYAFTPKYTSKSTVLIDEQ